MTVSIPPRTAEYLLLLAQAEVSRLYWYPETAPVLHERENAAEQVSILSRAIAAVKDESPLVTDLDCSLHEPQPWNAATQYQGGEKVLLNGKLETVSDGFNHPPGSMHDEQSKCVCGLRHYPEAHIICGEFKAGGDHGNDCAGIAPDGKACIHNKECHGAKP